MWLAQVITQLLLVLAAQLLFAKDIFSSRLLMLIAALSFCSVPPFFIVWAKRWLCNGRIVRFALTLLVAVSLAACTFVLRHSAGTPGGPGGSLAISIVGIIAALILHVVAWVEPPRGNTHE